LSRPVRQNQRWWHVAALLVAAAMLSTLVAAMALGGGRDHQSSAAGPPSPGESIVTVTSTTPTTPTTTPTTKTTKQAPLPSTSRPSASTTSRAPDAAAPQPSPPSSRPPTTTTRPRPPAVAWGPPVAVEGFNGETVDTARWWIYDSPDARPPRSPAAVSVQRGVLRLTGGFDAQGRDLSGGIGHKLNQRFGRWEVRFRADRGAGYSPAVLLWPQTENWPADGEIDLVEIPGGSRTTGYCFLHAPNNDVNGCRMRADFTRWHTVAVDWLPDHVTFWLDGIEQWTVRAPDPHIPSSSAMHLALQNDQGCDGFIPCRTAQTPPQVVMEVDFVRVYRAPR
jgi:hypothetical protein